MSTGVRLCVALALLCGIAACAPRVEDAARDSPGAPSQVLGEFEDDYGIGYSISEREWRQGSVFRFEIQQWHAGDKYLIARNHAGNPSDAGLWTRIDWVELEGMPPYEWAFCLSAYKAVTAAEAEQTTIANRDTPKTGCNGHPFSRMRRKPASAG